MGNVVPCEVVTQRHYEEIVLSTDILQSVRMVPLESTTNRTDIDGGAAIIP